MFGELETRGVRFEVTSSSIERAEPLTTKVAR
jgi:hypothetical protein